MLKAPALDYVTVSGQEVRPVSVCESGRGEESGRRSTGYLGRSPSCLCLSDLSKAVTHYFACLLCCDLSSSFSSVFSF